MATYQKIQKSFWTDPKVDDNFTPEDKYFYLYLLTNPHGNMCGCYEISMNQMKRETGYLDDTVRKLIERMQNVHRVIRYDPKTNEILLLNWFRYNWSNSPKVTKPILDDINLVKNQAFREYLTKLYNCGIEKSEAPSPRDIDTVSILYPYSSDTLSSVVESRVGEEKTEYHENTTDSVTIDYQYSISNSSQEDSLFDQLWTTYPKKSGDIRAACSEYFKAVQNGANPEEILRAVKGLAATKTEEELRYLPSFEKWLRNRAWNTPEDVNPVLVKSQELARRAAETAAYLAEGG